MIALDVVVKLDPRPPIHAHIVNETVSFSRLTITASCPMDLQYFPMDSQLCYIEIESCKLITILKTHSKLDLLFSWVHDE